MRTGVAVGISGSASAVVGEGREVVAVDQPEVLLDAALPTIVIGTEPVDESFRAARDTLNVRVGLAGVILGITSGSFDENLLDIREARVVFPLVVGAGDSEVARELNASNILNSGVEVPGGTVRIDVGKQVRRLDGVGSRTGSSKVVRSRD